MRRWWRRSFPVSGRRRAPTPADGITIVLVVAATVLLSLQLPRGGVAVAALVSCPDGEQRVRLDVDQELSCEGPLGTTRLQVRSGSIAIVQAPCRRQLCRRMGPTRQPSRSLVCIPNRVRVRVLSAAATREDIDARAR